MTAAARSGFRLLRGGAGQRPGERWTSERLLVALLVLGAAAVLVDIIWNLGSERRALRALPEEQRQVLLSRTVKEMREICGPARQEGLKAHCQALASFAAQFEECRGECLELVRRELAPQPPR